MYRILRPNGMWITDENWPEHLRFKDLKAAFKYAEQSAKSTSDYGEWLIYEGWNMEPSARFTLFDLFEEDD